MNKNFINSLVLIYLLCFMHFSTNINSISLTKNSIMKNLKKSESEDVGSAIDAGKMAGTCMKSLMDSIPPEFCWKKGADFGVIPTGCPSGYFRSLALCYQYCNPGYRHVLGICWADCSGGYTDHGLTCFKSLFSWYFKHSYIPGSLTNFSDRIPCPEGMYRGGALCYRNCENIGMANCGIGACASDSATCGSSIATMVVDVLQGLADAITTIASFGAASGAKALLKGGLKKLGKAALKKGMDSMKKVFTSKFKDVILEKAKISIKSKAKEIITGKLTELAIVNICKGIWNTAIDKTQNTVDINEDTLVNAVDVFNVKGIMTECKDTGDEKGAISCASSVLSGLSTFDPTGLLTIANAFMKPSCEVTTQVIIPTKDDEVIIAAVKVLEGTKENCVYLYDGCDYQGEFEEVCGDTVFLKKNDKASSLKAGKNVSGLLFEHANFNGRQIPFGPDMLIKCFEDFKNEEYQLQNLTSSVKFGADKCLIINYRTTTEKYKDFSTNKILCTSTPKADIAIPTSLEHINFRSYALNFSATIYSGENYTGESMEIKGNVNGDVAKFKLFNIKSYKINLA